MLHAFLLTAFFFKINLNAFIHGKDIDFYFLYAQINEKQNSSSALAILHYHKLWEKSYILPIFLLLLYTVNFIIFRGGWLCKVLPQISRLSGGELP